MTLFIKTIKDHGKAYFFWALGLIAMIGVQLSVYPTVRSSAAGLASFIENYPKALREIFRMEDYTSGAGYLSTELFSMMLPLMFIAVGASWGSNATAREEERRTADILLTLPISRVRILATKIGAAAFAQLVLGAIVVLSLAIGIRFVDLPLATTKIMAGALTAVLLGMLFNAVATFFGALSGNRTAAMGGAIGLAIAGFLFYSLAPLVNTFGHITPINPFQWTLGSRALYNGVDMGYTIVALLLTVVLYLGSIFLFRRRDIRA